MANAAIRQLLAPTRDDVSQRVLLAVRGSCETVINKMKLSAGVETDAELAAFLHKDRSAVAQWRRRGAVPETAILRFLIISASAPRA